MGSWTCASSPSRGRCCCQRQGAFQPRRSQFAPAAIRARRVDRLRSRLRSGPDSAGTAPALMRNEGSAGFADRTADFPFVTGLPNRRRRSCASYPTARLSIWPCSTPTTRPCSIATSWAAITQPTTFDGHAAHEATVEADFETTAAWTAPHRARTAKFTCCSTAAALAATGFACSLTGIKSLKLAQDAEVEIKAGTLYRKADV